MEKPHGQNKKSHLNEWHVSKYGSTIVGAVFGGIIIHSHAAKIAGDSMSK